jgi:hypothetical protein
VEGTRLLREKQVLGDPAGAIAPRRLPDRPRKAKCLERKSTDKFNSLKIKKLMEVFINGTNYSSFRRKA